MRNASRKVKHRQAVFTANQIRLAAQILGAIGGRAGRGASKSRGTELARKAALERWRRYRETLARTQAG